MEKSLVFTERNVRRHKKVNTLECQKHNREVQHDLRVTVYKRYFILYFIMI